MEDVTCTVPHPRRAGKKGPQPGLTSEGLTWPLCPMVAMGTVPVLQEAGRAVSCFEEGSRAVFLQSACPKRGRKPSAGPPLLLGVWWSHAHAQPARRGRCGNAASGKSQTGSRRKKNGWPEEGGHFLHRPWIPPSGDKNSEWPCPASDSPSPELSPSLGSQRPAAQRLLRPLPVPLTHPCTLDTSA